MSRPDFHTPVLHGYLNRLRDGDDRAFDELIGHTEERLHLLARHMLRRYPAVGRWEDEADVLQDALLRLVRDLRDKHKRPGSVREFFSLAASRIRSVLLDLHRHYQGPRGLGAHHAGGAPPSADAGQDADSGGGPTELERWSAFHEAVEKLDATDREVVGLIFYHGWKQADVAELLQVSVRTVSKHWGDACGRLKEMLGDSLPGF